MRTALDTVAFVSCLLSTSDRQTTITAAVDAALTGAYAPAAHRAAGRADRVGGEQAHAKPRDRSPSRPPSPPSEGSSPTLSSPPDTRDIGDYYVYLPAHQFGADVPASRSAPPRIHAPYKCLRLLRASGLV